MPTVNCREKAAFKVILVLLARTFHFPRICVDLFSSYLLHHHISKLICSESLLKFVLVCVRARLRLCVRACLSVCLSIYLQHFVIKVLLYVKTFFFFG
jgi:hypothetical protein